MTDPIQPPAADPHQQPGQSLQPGAPPPPTTPIPQIGYLQSPPFGYQQAPPPGYGQPPYGGQYGYQAPPPGYQVPPPGYGQPYAQPVYAQPYDPYAKSRLAAGLLGIFLGGFGVHRFYLGYPGIGVAQIFVTLFTGIGAWWGIIEGIMILAKAQSFQTDATGRPLRD